MPEHNPKASPLAGSPDGTRGGWFEPRHHAPSAARHPGARLDADRLRVRSPGFWRLRINPCQTLAQPAAHSLDACQGIPLSDNVPGSGGNRSSTAAHEPPRRAKCLLYWAVWAPQVIRRRWGRAPPRSDLTSPFHVDRQGLRRCWSRLGIRNLFRPLSDQV